MQLVTSAVREIPQRVARPPAAVDCRLDRRPAAGTRRAAHAGHLRPHPQTHRRPLDHGALHGHAAAGQPAGIHRGVSARSGRRSRKSRRSGSACTRRRLARSPRSGCRRPIASSVVADLHGAAAPLSEAAMPEGADRGVRRPARVARRMRVRADDDDDLGGSDDEDHAVPVRRRARLQQLRLHRLGRPGRRRPAPAARRDPGRRRSSTDRCKVGERCGGCGRPSRRRLMLYIFVDSVAHAQPPASRKVRSAREFARGLIDTAIRCSSRSSRSAAATSTAATATNTTRSRRRSRRT